MTDAPHRTPDPTDAPDAARIAAQNDRFRRHVCLGAALTPGEPLAGTLVVTLGVLAEGDAFVRACLRAVGAVTVFPPEDDPEGWHDFGAVEVRGQEVWFKLDLYDAQDPTWGSEAPDDPARTWRVLTVLLPCEW